MHLFYSCLSQSQGDCKDVTVGACTLDGKDIIQNVDIFTDVEDCQFYCNGLTNCELFRFDGQTCTLLTKDYRKDCQIFAGPYVRENLSLIIVFSFMYVYDHKKVYKVVNKLSY